MDEAEGKLQETLDPYIDWVADRMEPVRRQLTFDTLREKSGTERELTKLQEALKRKLSKAHRQESD